MYLLLRSILASLIGAGAIATLEANPIVTLLMASVSVMMWISILSNLLKLVQFVGS
jgi:hypothetical protein